MNLAIILMMLTALPVIYYYYTMYQINEKTRYIIGQLAGLWGLIGVLVVSAGVIRFWYFIIYIGLIILVYLFNKIMNYVDENFDEDEEEEYEVEWPVDVSNAAMAFLTLVLVILLYCAVLLAPVSAARINDPTGFDEDEGSYKAFPDGYMYEYKSLAYNSYVVVLTIRSVPITQGMLEDALEKAKPEVEEYIRENYGENAEVEYTGSDTLEIKGYDAVEKNFDVKWTRLGGQKTAEMTLQAFFYPKDLEVIVIGYVYPPEGRSPTLGMVGNLEC